MPHEPSFTPAATAAAAPAAAATAPAAWVLVRGLTREARHWGALTPALAAALAPCPVLAVDLPGNGARWRERSPASVDALAQDLHATLSGMGLPRPWGVLAMSLGAMVTVAMARRHPQDLAAALLVNTSLARHAPPWWRLRPGAALELLQALAAPAARRPGRLERAILARTTTRAPALAPVLVPWDRWRREAPVSTGNAWRQLWAAARERGPATAPPVPTRLLVGDGDRLVDPRCSAALAAAWGVPLRRHPWGGHDLPLDDPDWVVAQVLEMAHALGRAGPAPSGAAPA